MTGIERGRFITFEGGDGSGKSTQIGMTAEFLRSRGHNVLLTCEPGDTPLGAQIRRLLLSGEYLPVPESELLLFLADRAQHVRETIAPALDRGDWVVCDRYSDSTLAYQLAGRRLAGHEDMLSQMVKFAELGVVPDITFWLDLPVAVGLQRVRSRASAGEASNRLDDEALTFHEKVHAAFASLHAKDPQRIRAIDATMEVARVQHAIQAVLAEVVP